MQVSAGPVEQEVNRLFCFTMLTAFTEYNWKELNINRFIQWNKSYKSLAEESWPLAHIL